MKLLILLMAIWRLINHSLEDSLQMEYDKMPNKVWFAVFGVHFSSTYNLPTYTADSYSHCRVICFTKNCSAVSMVAMATRKIDCRIKLTPNSPKRFPEMNFDRISGAFFYTTEDFSKYELINGLFYYATKPAVVLLLAIYNPTYCEGHFQDTGKTPVLKSEAKMRLIMTVLSKTGYALEYSPTNLNYNSVQNGWLWKDGTIYSQTELGAKYQLPPPNETSLFEVQTNTISKLVTFKVPTLLGNISVTVAADTVGLYGNYTIVCQLNPFNILTFQ